MAEKLGTDCVSSEFLVRSELSIFEDTPSFYPDGVRILVFRPIMVGLGVLVASHLARCGIVLVVV